jgi:hypothetical protein
MFKDTNFRNFDLLGKHAEESDIFASTLSLDLISI